LAWLQDGRDGPFEEDAAACTILAPM